MLIKDMDSDALKALVTTLHDAVYQAECFSSRDVLLLHQGSAELERRGYTLTDIPQLLIEDPEDLS